MAQINITKSTFDYELAKLQGHPDFAFSFNYINIGDGETTMPNDGQDAWMITARTTLPLWLDQNEAIVNKKSASKKNVQNLAQQQLNKTKYEIENLYYQIKQLNSSIDLYKTTLIPLANQAFEAAKISFESGRTDFINWLSLRKDLLGIQITYQKLVSDRQISLAKLEQIIGVTVQASALPYKVTKETKDEKNNNC